MIKAILCLLLLATAALAQRAAPKPPLEQFPPVPYVSPPTPAEKAEARERMKARAALDAACLALLEELGVSRPTNSVQFKAATVAVTEHKAALRKVKNEAAKTNQSARAAVAVYEDAKKEAGR